MTGFRLTVDHIEQLGDLLDLVNHDPANSVAAERQLFSHLLWPSGISVLLFRLQQIYPQDLLAFR